MFKSKYTIVAILIFMIFSISNIFSKVFFFLIVNLHQLLLQYHLLSMCFSKTHNVDLPIPFGPLKRFAFGKFFFSTYFNLEIQRTSDFGDN